mmetsp:Transcript_121873/g.379356  ORF Transcript_121873/g.379356 Transcript_121873/m.379356 type:complete len:231 (-) Transcript_121873:475-1167(-)
MLRTGKPSCAMDRAKSIGWGNLRMDFSKYSYSSPPEPMVATLPIAGTTWVMKLRAKEESKLLPSGRANSKMQTRLDDLLRKTLRISRSARVLSGTFRIPKAMDILSMDPVATPAVGDARAPCESMPRTRVKFWASPFTSRTTPARPSSSTLATPRRSISELGSTPNTASAASLAPPPSCCKRVPARMLTSAVPVARSNTRSSRSNRMQSWIKVLRQNWSRPKDIHLLVES